MIFLIPLFILLLITAVIHKMQQPSWTPVALGILGILTLITALGVIFTPSKSEAAGKIGERLNEQRLAIQAEYAAQWLEKDGSFKQAVYMSDRQLPGHKILENAFVTGLDTIRGEIYVGDSENDEINETEMGFSFKPQDLAAVRTQFPEADVLVWSSPPRFRRKPARKPGPRGLKYLVLNADKDWFARISAAPARRRLLLAAIIDKPYGSRGSDLTESIPNDLEAAFQSEFELLTPDE